MVWNFFKRFSSKRGTPPARLQGLSVVIKCVGHITLARMLETALMEEIINQGGRCLLVTNEELASEPANLYIECHLEAVRSLTSDDSISVDVRCLDASGSIVWAKIGAMELDDMQNLTCLTEAALFVAAHLTSSLNLKMIGMESANASFSPKALGAESVSVFDFKKNPPPGLFVDRSKSE